MLCIFNDELINGKPSDTLLDTSDKPNKKKKNVRKNAHIQEAHEAIRPTNISLQMLPENIEAKEKRMYKLIWTNTMESCMKAASYYSITASISAPENNRYSLYIRID